MNGFLVASAMCRVGRSWWLGLAQNMMDMMGRTSNQGYVK